MNEHPPGWADTTIDQVSVQVAKHRPAERPDTDFTYIDISSLDNQRHTIAEAKRIAGRDAPSRARQVVKAGDTLLSTVRTYLKNTALVPAALEGATASTGFCVLRSCSGVDSRFLFYRVLDGEFVRSLSARQTGTSYPAVRDSDVRAMPIALPPTVEQERIVEAIEDQWSRIEGGVESLERAKRNLARLRASTIAAALAPAGINGNRDSVGAPHAEGWFEATVGEVLAEPLANGRSVKGADAEDGFPVLRLTAVRNGEIDLSQRKIGAWTASDAAPFLVQSGDFFISRGSGSLHLVGRCGLVVGLPDPVAFPDLLIRLRPDESVLDRPFLRALWESPVTRRQIEQAARTTAGIYKINQKDIRNFVIRFPPLDEQRRIVAELDRKLSALDAVQQVVEGGLKRAGTLRRAILREAFAGRLVPQNPADEPASALIERIRTERAKP